MKIWENTLTAPELGSSGARLLAEDSMLFDIETTGFSAAYTTLYLIGTIRRKDDLLVLTQYFADTPDEEPQLLAHFFEDLTGIRTLVSYNGDGFDLPYLKARCEKLHLTHPFDTIVSVDLYKEVCAFRFLLSLPNYKLKTVEAFLGISRSDPYNGGELIEVYRHYGRTGDKEALLSLKQHNYEDVADMPALLSLLSYRSLFEGGFSVTSVESNLFCDIDGVMQKEMIFTLSQDEPLPGRASCRYNEYYLRCDKTVSKLTVRLRDGELKYFFQNPHDYYYLPEEDIAVHKSLISGVDKDHRKKATSSTCYTRKKGIFLPQLLCNGIDIREFDRNEYFKLFSPAFRETRKDRLTWFELTEEFLDSDAALHAYILHILQKLLLVKP